MAKRNKNKLANLMIALVSAITAAVAFIGLACNFINQKSTTVIGGYTSEVKWNLSSWFDAINDMKDFDDIGNWQVARILLIITTILLVVMLALLVVRSFVKHPIIKWSTFAVSIVAAVCGALFMVLTLIGCGALGGNALVANVEYFANVGVYLFAIGSAVSGISAAIVALRK